jgi:hypothetical protein
MVELAVGHLQVLVTLVMPVVGVMALLQAVAHLMVSHQWILVVDLLAIQWEMLWVLLMLLLWVILVGWRLLALMEQWQLWMVLRPQTWQKVWMPQMLAQKLLAQKLMLQQTVLTTPFKLTYIVRHQISFLVPEFSLRKINHAVRSPGSSNHCAKARRRAR